MSHAPEPPLLSVVVPIYNVGSYLAPCLESLLDSTLQDIEIVCVDDGSTDGSGEVAEQFARRDARVTVLHVPNGGLGRARNIGLDHASGRYLAFVDSDDRVTPTAYERLCGSLEVTGSDIASGHVRRFTDTSAWLSGLHERAIQRSARATHITRELDLVYDTTAWNKVFRRSFWDQHGFRFPEGVLYEDMGVTLPAHVLARSVDLLTTVVYEWRERGDGSMSITQRRAELKNLQDRLTALESVNDFLTAHDVPEVRSAHDRKVLQLDLKLYLDVLDVAGPEYRELFHKHVHDYLEHVAADDLARLPVWERVAYELLRRDRLVETIELLQERRRSRRVYALRRKGVRLYADLPFFGDPAVGLPDSLFAIAKKLPVKSSVNRLEIRGDTLTIDGSAFISRVGMDHAWSSLRWLALHDEASGHRIRCPAVPRREPELTVSNGTERFGFDMGGFSARVPLRRLRAPDHGVADYGVAARIAHPAARRGVQLGRGTASVPRPGPVTVRRDGAHVAAYSDQKGWLHIAVRRDYALAESVSFDDAGALRLELRFPHPVQPGDVLRLRADDTPALEAELTPDPNDPLRATSVVDLGPSRLQIRDEAPRTWQLAVEPAQADQGPDAARARAVVASPGFRGDERHDDTTGRQLAARVGIGGQLVLVDRPVHAMVRSARWDGGTLVLDATVAHQVTGVAFRLVHSDGARLESADLRRDGDRVTVRFEVAQPQRCRSILPGGWLLHAESEHGRTLPLEIDEAGVEPAEVTPTEYPMLWVTVNGPRLTVHVRATRQRDSGARNQQLRRAVDYSAARRTPLRDTILFQSWAGKQYSDNPRAIYEQLRRQGRDNPMVWVRSSTAVEVPDDVPFVIAGSREYYETLATARYVVSNDSMPPYYEKRTGSHYLQTWHGTPLKRIGFDIENAQFGNPKYLDEFAVEVTKWDRLISPNGFSTEIFRRAFDYRGEVLETGYPRNDLFYAPDAGERRAAVRERLGVLPGQRVVLWAPTWREDQRDSRGRYSLPLPFDLTTWNHILQPEDLLLFRGHQLLQATVGGTLGGLRQVRNVTDYPDIQELYLAADVLITDYSSVMFDFANTRRPMIFYAWDLDHYRNELRGFYLDFEQTVPGPIVTDIDGLSDALSNTAAATASSAAAYDRFVQRFGALEDGHAAERAIEAFFDS